MKRLIFLAVAAIALTSCSNSLDNVYNPSELSAHIKEIKDEKGDSVSLKIQKQIKFSLFKSEELLGKTYEEILTDYESRQVKISLLKSDLKDKLVDINNQVAERTKVMDSIKSGIKFEIVSFKQWKSSGYSSFYTYGTEVKVTLPKGVSKVVASYYPSFNGEHLFFESSKVWRNKTYKMTDSYNDKISGFNLEDVSNTLYITRIITNDGENIYSEGHFPEVDGYDELKSIYDDLDELGAKLTKEEVASIKYYLVD